VEDEARVAFRLDGLHPSPWTAGTLRMRFSQSESARVSLDLLDLAGRLIQRRDLGIFPSGSHAVTVGERHNLSSGVYLLILHSGGRSIGRRIVVLD
jgi:hypothetical protein